MSINQFIIDGNLTRAPEVRYTPRGTPVCTFTVAVNTVHGSGEDRREETAFIPVTTIGKLAETSARNLRKGAAVTVMGRLGSWFNQEKKKGGFNFEAERVIFRSRPSNATKAQDNAPAEPAASTQGVQATESSQNDVPDQEWIRDFDNASQMQAAH